jgi:hypothetical protein
VITEDLHTRLYTRLARVRKGSELVETHLCVGVVGRLEAQVFETHVCEEVTEETLETCMLLI